MKDRFIMSVIGLLLFAVLVFSIGYKIGISQVKTVEKEVIQYVEVAAEDNAEDEPEKIDYYPLNEQEYKELCEVVMAEAGGESYEGQMAVAQCILNACLKEDIRPNEAIVQYKYTPIRKTASDSVKNAVKAVFINGEKVTDEEILYFYAPKYCESKWHESQKFVVEIGGHRFFALK